MPEVVEIDGVRYEFATKKQVEELQESIKEHKRWLAEMKSDVAVKAREIEDKARERMKDVTSDIHSSSVLMRQMSSRIEQLTRQVEDLKKDALGVADLKAVTKKLDDLANRVKQLEK
jgi:polyhydroxyalkanoate synthesis regulator phasin